MFGREFLVLPWSMSSVDREFYVIFITSFLLLYLSYVIFITLFKSYCALGSRKSLKSSQEPLKLTRGATVTGCAPVVSFCSKGLYLYDKQT